MALHEEWNRLGTKLFAWRSYLPLPALLLVFPCMRYIPDSGLRSSYVFYWKLFCMAVSFFGLGIRILTIGHTPEGTSGRNTAGQVAEALNTTGIYSQLRHPLYLGNFFIWLGISLFCGLWWLTVILGLMFWIYYERIMYAEEQFLSEKYGEAFHVWADHTPAFIPKFRRWRRAQLSFSIKNVLKREYSGFFGIIFTFVVLETGENLIVRGKLYLDPVWTGIFLLGSGIYALLRAISKLTKVFEVTGR
jgi:protein-S-isoprenylcysteine O-methyltransferase Ste14